MNAESLLVIPSSSDFSAILESGKFPEKDKSPDLDWYFPKVDPGNIPLGARVLVQLRRTKETSRGGIVLPSDTKETEKWNNQVAKITLLGPLAYRNRETKEPWAEGVWVQEGDFVRVPRWGGDRWEVQVEGEKEAVTFCIFNDHEVITKITTDPLKVLAFII